MTAFLKDTSAFLGDGTENEMGQNLSSFLDEYDPNKYENPSVTADVLVFQHNGKISSINKGLKLLMIKRRNHPSIGYYALPGGFIEIREDILEAAKRELKEETGLNGIALEQLYCWGNYDRDPRTRIVTASYLALVDKELTVKAGDDANEALWFDVSIKKVGHEKLLHNRKFQNYEISLVNEEKSLNLDAVVEYSENLEGYLKQKDFKVVNSNHIAFYPSFIVQALLYINTLIK